jgi:hypothetical protein
MDVAEEIAALVDLPHGSRPRRLHIDPADDGAQVVSQVRDRLRKGRLHIAGYGQLLDVKQ